MGGGMRRLAAFLILFVITGLLLAGTRANILGRSGSLWILDKGEEDGVEIGMKGYFWTTFRSGGRLYSDKIAIFKVVKVEAKRCFVEVIEWGGGWSPSDVKWAEFEAELEGIPSGKSIDWYLDRGDEARRKGNCRLAVKYYKKVLELEPDDPAATKGIERCRQMEEKRRRQQELARRRARRDELLRRGEKYEQEGDYEVAAAYYVKAYNALPEEGEPALRKLEALYSKAAEEVEKIISKYPKLKAIIFKALIEVFVRHPELSPDPVFKQVAAKAERLYINEAGYPEAVLYNNTVMIYIPPGEFIMGSPEGEGDDDEHPQHRVYLDGYWISKYEVTMGQYKKFISETRHRSLPDWVSEYSPLDKYPVVGISWEDAAAYCKWLSRKTGLPFRLPTEAEWEKACRGSDGRRYPWGNSEPDGNKANYCDVNCPASWRDNTIDDGYKYTAPVGSYPQGASPYGLLDMAGNVWEWVQDWYDKRYYSRSPYRNPAGPSSGSLRVIRGGGWFNAAGDIRCALRNYVTPSKRLVDLGFRPAIGRR